MGTTFSALMGTTFSALMGTTFSTLMGTTFSILMGTTFLTSMATTLFDVSGDHIFYILAHTKKRTGGASILPELRTTNTGDIAVVVGFVIFPAISHVGMMYFGRLFELCCASPAHAHEPLIFAFPEVIRQSVGPCRKQVKKEKK